MKTKISLFAIADEVIFESSTKKNSLIGVFQLYGAEKVPVQIPKFVTYFRLVNTVGIKGIVISIKDPEGNLVDTVPFSNLDIKESSLNVNAYFFNGTYETFGKYNIEIEVDGETLEPMLEQYLDVIEVKKEK